MGGNLWPKSFSLWFVDQITWKQCTPDLGDLGVSLSNQSLLALEEHLGSPLARANLATLGNLDLLENPNVTSSQQSFLNLTAIGSNFCQSTEQVDSCKSMAGMCDTL